MTVTTVTRKLDGLSGSLTKPYAREYTLELFVTTDSANDGPVAIWNSGRLPALWSPYLLPLYNCGNDEDERALCTSIALDPIGEDGKHWLAKLKFETDAIPKSENPLDDPVLYSMTWEQFDRVVEKDLDGKPLANTVGDLFTDPPFTQQENRPVLIAKRNESQIPVATMLAYNDRVNSAPFYGADENTVKCRITCSETQVRNEIYFYTVQYEFVFRDDSWQPSLLNRGHRANTVANGKPAELPNKEMRNLKQDGTQLGADEEPYYVDFTTLQSADFNALGV